MSKKTSFILSFSLLVVVSFSYISLSYFIKSFNPKVLGESVQSSVKNTTKKEYTVTKVIDGDTVVIETGEHIRLIGIDAPEISKKECYSEESKKYLSELLENKKVKLEKDISEKDKYGRLLRYIYLEDVFVNERLVEKGFAKAVIYKPDIKHSNLFEISENVSQNNKMGMWGSCAN
ncbi:thermonuclease family protein [Patescibacteria group bacterium]|nr:thermonuclease family protein [Patescibacteria group bacterium]